MSWVPLIFWRPLLIGAPLARLPMGESGARPACRPGFEGPRGPAGELRLFWTAAGRLRHGGDHFRYGDSAVMRSALLALLLLSSTAAGAQLPANFTRANPAPRIDRIPPARDIAYPGTIQLTVDATDTVRRIFRIHEHIPVA